MIALIVLVPRLLNSGSFRTFSCSVFLVFISLVLLIMLEITYTLKRIYICIWHFQFVPKDFKYLKDCLVKSEFIFTAFPESCGTFGTQLLQSVQVFKYSHCLFFFCHEQ